MQSRRIEDDIHWVGALDWDRRKFDELIPLPDGTTYNAYFIHGQRKNVLIDTVDPSLTDVLMERLSHLKVDRVDYVVSNHAEQDHSGSIPHVLKRYPEAKVVCTPRAKGMLVDLLDIAESRFQTVEDGETLDMGGKTLKFIHFPWVHWPETMLTYLPESRTLFPCDLFGAHLTVGDLSKADGAMGLLAAKRYYAEIMMPFRAQISKSLPKVTGLALDRICPSHGPLLNEPKRILDAYQEWLSDTPRNLAVLAYTSMHASTRLMVQRLSECLVGRGVDVEIFNLADVDLGKLAMSLVDAATIVLGSPTVNGGAHPAVAYAAYVANLLKPKARFGAIVGSYSWGGKMTDGLMSMMPNLKLEVVGTVLAKGLPKEADLAALEALAEAIAEKHQGLSAKV